VLLVRAVHDGRATHFSNLLPVAVVRPAADLLAADHVLDEQDATVETQRQLVKQFNVLQQVVVGVTAHTHASNSKLFSTLCRLFVYLETPAKQTSSAAYHSLGHYADEIYSFNQSTKMYSTFLRSRQMHLSQLRKQLIVLIYLNSNSTNEPLAY